MKKGLLILVLCCVAIFSKAQIDKTKGYLYLNGGVNYASLYESSEYASETGGIFGPELGLSLRAKYKSYWGWGFEVGGYYSVKGTKFKDADNKVTLDYGGLFVNGLLYFPLVNDDDIYIGGGIYSLYAFSGKSKSDTASSSIKFGDSWKRYDGGLQLKAAYEIKNFLALGLHYDFGFFPTFSSTDSRGDDFNSRNSTVTLFASIRLIKLFEK
jgi:Outer membrane protein beta-barrel domain